MASTDSPAIIGFEGQERLVVVGVGGALRGPRGSLEPLLGPGRVTVNADAEQRGRRARGGDRE